MKITCSRRTPTREVLQHIYDVMNKNIKNPKKSNLIILQIHIFLLNIFKKNQNFLKICVDK